MGYISYLSNLLKEAKKKDPLATKESMTVLHNVEARRQEHDALKREQGFPEEQDPNAMRYQRYAEMETDEQGKIMHNKPPWVVNEASEMIAEINDEDAPTYKKSDKARNRAGKDTASVTKSLFNSEGQNYGGVIAPQRYEIVEKTDGKYSPEEAKAAFDKDAAKVMSGRQQKRDAELKQERQSADMEKGLGDVARKVGGKIKDTFSSEDKPQKIRSTEFAARQAAKHGGLESDWENQWTPSSRAFPQQRKISEDFVARQKELGSPEYLASKKRELEGPPSGTIGAKQRPDGSWDLSRAASPVKPDLSSKESIKAHNEATRAKLRGGKQSKLVKSLIKLYKTHEPGHDDAPKSPNTPVTRTVTNPYTGLPEKRTARYNPFTGDLLEGAAPFDQPESSDEKAKRKSGTGIAPTSTHMPDDWGTQSVRPSEEGKQTHSKRYSSSTPLEDMEKGHEPGHDDEAGSVSYTDSKTGKSRRGRYDPHTGDQLPGATNFPFGDKRVAQRAKRKSGTGLTPTSVLEPDYPASESGRMGQGKQTRSKRYPIEDMEKGTPGAFGRSMSRRGRGSTPGAGDFNTKITSPDARDRKKNPLPPTEWPEHDPTGEGTSEVMRGYRRSGEGKKQAPVDKKKQMINNYIASLNKAGVGAGGPTSYGGVISGNIKEGGSLYKPTQEEQEDWEREGIREQKNPAAFDRKELPSEDLSDIIDPKTGNFLYPKDPQIENFLLGGVGRAAVGGALAGGGDDEIEMTEKAGFGSGGHARDQQRQFNRMSSGQKKRYGGMGAMGFAPAASKNKSKRGTKK